jgi:hypothetical protein
VSDELGAHLRRRDDGGIGQRGRRGDTEEGAGEHRREASE